MASIKLTNASRDAIIRKLLMHTFQAQHDELLKADQEMAKSFYDTLYTKQELALMKRLPENWVQKRAALTMYVGSDYHQLYFGGHVPVRNGLPYNMFTDKQKKPKNETVWPMPGDPNIKLKKSDAEAIRFEKHVQRLKQFQEDLGEAQRQAKAVIYTATTVGKLIELWPEIEPFCPKEPELPVGGRGVVIPLAQLNDKFKLPVPKSKKAA